MNISEAQKDMRTAYYGGGTGAIASGLIWLIAGVMAWQGEIMNSMLLFFIGGMFIFPASILISKLFKRSGKHQKANPLAKLSIETTVLIFVGLFIAYTMYHSFGDWFYSIMAMIIGGRYLMFQSVYGMKVYWLLGGLMILAGISTMVLMTEFHVPAIAGGLIELIMAFVIMSQEKKLAA